MDRTRADGTAARLARRPGRPSRCLPLAPHADGPTERHDSSRRPGPRPNACSPSSIRNHDGSITRRRPRPARQNDGRHAWPNVAKRFEPRKAAAGARPRRRCSTGSTPTRTEHQPSGILAAKPGVREHRMMVCATPERPPMPGGAMMRMRGMGMGGRHVRSGGRQS